MNRNDYEPHGIVNACAIALMVGFAPLAAAQAPGGSVTSESNTAPGKRVEVKTLEIAASVEALDTVARTVTLKGPQGNLLVLPAGPDVRNFDRIKVGDQVVARYQEALSIELKKGGNAPVGRVEGTMAVKAAPGEKPAAGGGRQVTVTADVVALDARTQTVTLRGPQRTIAVRVDDAEQFKRVALGDQVEAMYIEAVAVSVEPATRK